MKCGLWHYPPPAISEFNSSVKSDIEFNDTDFGEIPSETFCIDSPKSNPQRLPSEFQVKGPHIEQDQPLHDTGLHDIPTPINEMKVVDGDCD